MKETFMFYLKGLGEWFLKWWEEELKQLVWFSIKVNTVFLIVIFTHDYWRGPVIEFLKGTIKWLGGETC